MALFKVISECYVEAPTAKQAIDAQIDQLTQETYSVGFYNPAYDAFFGSGSHKVIPCDENGEEIRTVEK